MCGHRYDHADELQITNLRVDDVPSLIAVLFINCLFHYNLNGRKALNNWIFFCVDLNSNKICLCASITASKKKRTVLVTYQIF